VTKTDYPEKEAHMTKIVEKDNIPRDYYTASLKNESLVMQPYCACGNSLDEDYFCEKCGKKCHCHLIICDNTVTLNLVKDYIRKSSQFSGFKAKLAGER
jgi:hypothetical protein